MTESQAIATMRAALEWIADNGPDDAWELRQRAREALRECQPAAAPDPTPPACPAHGAGPGRVPGCRDCHERDRGKPRN